MQNDATRSLGKYLQRGFFFFFNVWCLWQLCGFKLHTSSGLLLSEWCHDAKDCCESLLIYDSLTERTPHPTPTLPTLPYSYWPLILNPPHTRVCAAACMCRLFVNRGGTCSITCTILPLWAPQLSLPHWFYALVKQNNSHSAGESVPKQRR